MTFCFFGMVLYWALVTKLPRYAAAFPLESSMGVEYNKLTRNFFFIICVVPSSALCRLPCQSHSQNNFEMFFWCRGQLLEGLSRLM